MEKNLIETHILNNFKIIIIKIRRVNRLLAISARD